jgi:putative FmdB family regulatory protein
MPIYEYRCEACNHAFERLQSFRDESVSICPVCGEARCRRLISAPGIVFKGSGWYIKDSRQAGRGGERGASGGDAGVGGGDGGTSKDGGDSSSLSQSSGSSDSAGSSDSGGSSGSSNSGGSGGDDKPRRSRDSKVARNGGGNTRTAGASGTSGNTAGNPKTTRD